MNKKILITGASGFIASHFIRKYDGQYDFYCVTRETSKYKNNINLNLSQRLDYSDLEKIFYDIKADVLIHTASRLAGENETNDIGVLYDNIGITANIVNICKICKVEKLINFSSIAVYPNIDGIFNENRIIDPSKNTEGIYGLSKFCSEQLLDFYLKKYVSRILHLRISQVSGDGMRKDRLMEVMKKELMQTNNITVFGNGERISNFIDIEKLLKIIAAGIELDIAGIYNIGDENLSYSDIAERLIRKYGSENSKIIYIDNGSKAKFYLDTKKINSLFNLNNE